MWWLGEGLGKGSQDAIASRWRMNDGDCKVESDGFVAVAVDVGLHLVLSEKISVGLVDVQGKSV